MTKATKLDLSPAHRIRVAHVKGIVERMVKPEAQRVSNHMRKETRAVVPNFLLCFVEDSYYAAINVPVQHLRVCLRQFLAQIGDENQADGARFRELKHLMESGAVQVTSETLGEKTAIHHTKLSEHLDQHMNDRLKEQSEKLAAGEVPGDANVVVHGEPMDATAFEAGTPANDETKH